MKGDQIPDPDHIARLCQPKHVPDGQIQASAFMLKSDEEGLSVNWLEFLECSSRDHEIAKIRNVYSLKFNRIGARATIAVINVGEVRERVLTESEDRRNLEVLHDPKEDGPPDPSHSEIYNLTQDDELIAELIL
ncbi:MAG: hypothetical protein JRD01_09550 [Deltaproteobacteria bacterium]|nr:hypothetical protein [Deltaproteobacteria bacterium]